MGESVTGLSLAQVMLFPSCFQGYRGACSPSLGLHACPFHLIIDQRQDSHTVRLINRCSWRRETLFSFMPLRPQEWFKNNQTPHLFRRFAEPGQLSDEGRFCAPKEWQLLVKAGFVGLGGGRFLSHV